MTRAGTNQAVHLQKMARGLKFWIKEVEGLYNLRSENKGADQLCCNHAAGFRICNAGFLMAWLIFYTFNARHLIGFIYAVLMRSECGMQ